MTTMRDVARRAGVSAKTVSRVYNHDPHVGPATKDRVEVALRELDYVPSTLSTAFRSGRAPVMGVAVPDIADPFFGALTKAVEARAAVHGMSVVITSLGEDPAREPAIVQALLRQSLSGLVIAPITDDQSYLGGWAGRTQLVFVDRRPVGIVADSFTEDDHSGARAATRHLVEHGHVRIGFLGDSTAIPTSRGRLVGYRAGLRDAAIEYDESLVVLGARDRASAAAACSALERLDEPPTAIFASNARVTMSLVPALRADKRLALAGFGDFPMADVLEPSVTVIDQDPDALGTLAAQRILDRVAHPQRRYRRHTVLPVELVERASCFPTGRRG